MHEIQYDPLQQTQLQSLIDSMPDLIFYKDQSSRYLGCNKAFERFVGNQRDQIIGKTDLDLFSKDVAEFFREKDKNMLASGNPQRNEEWVKFPDGTSVLLDTLKTPYSGQDGKILGLIGVSRDITQLHVKHEQLKHNLSLQEATFESTTDGILVIDRRGKWINYNAKFLTLWNVPNSIIESGDDIAIIDHVLSQLTGEEATLKKMMSFYEQTDPDNCDELLLNDGRVFERYSIPQVLNKKTIGSVWSFRDITTRKNAEKRSQLLTNLLNQASDCIFVIDPIDGRILEVNERASKTLGYSEEEFLSKTVMDISVMDDDFTWEKHLQEIRSQVTTTFEVKHIRKDGSKIPVEISVNISMVGENEYLLATARDITKRKKSGE